MEVSSNGASLSHHGIQYLDVSSMTGWFPSGHLWVSLIFNHNHICNSWENHGKPSYMYGQNLNGLEFRMQRVDFCDPPPPTNRGARSVIPCEAPNDRVHWPYQLAPAVWSYPPAIQAIIRTPFLGFIGDVLIKAPLCEWCSPCNLQLPFMEGLG